jgi:hypothetical protein
MEREHEHEISDCYLFFRGDFLIWITSALSLGLAKGGKGSFLLKSKFSEVLTENIVFVVQVEKVYAIRAIFTCTNVH